MLFLTVARDFIGAPEAVGVAEDGLRFDSVAEFLAFDTLVLDGVQIVEGSVRGRS